jgi:NitT/TauT family transport system permease protein
VKSPVFARILFPFLILAVWLIAIEILNSIWSFGTEVLPTPLEVWNFMWDEITTNTLARRNLYSTFALSLRRLGIGFVISMVLGTAIGLGMGLSKAVDAFFHDWVMALLAMPALAWALFLSLLFGFGDAGPIYAVILAGIPFVIVNIKEGVRNAPSDLFAMARAFGVPQSTITRHVLIPSLMPFMFAAARYAFSIGWKGLVITEVFGGQDGAGWTIKFWYDAHRAHGIVGYAMFFVIFALATERLILEPLSRRVFKWRPSLETPELVEQAFAPELLAEHAVEDALTEPAGGERA